MTLKSDVLIFNCLSLLDIWTSINVHTALYCPLWQFGKGVTFGQNTIMTSLCDPTCLKFKTLNWDFEEILTQQIYTHTHTSLYFSSHRGSFIRG